MAFGQNTGNLSQLRKSRKTLIAKKPPRMYLIGCSGTGSMGVGAWSVTQLGRRTTTALSNMPALALSSCRTRRERLMSSLAVAQLDAVVVSDVRDIYYFTGTLLPNELPAVLCVTAGGKTFAVFPDSEEVPGVDRIISYAWNERGTRHPDPLRRFTSALGSELPGWVGSGVGVQAESLPWLVAQLLNRAGVSQLVPLDETIAGMQRRKDADEIELIRASAQANLAAYAAVAAAISPGVNELDVLAAGRRGAARAAREKVIHDGDYQCGEYNGPARDRPIELGELYIVDAWTCYRGYWSDMSRTYAVGTEPTELQRSLFEHIRWVQSEVPKLLRPGVDGMDVYRAIDEMIRQHPPLADQGLIHHGGHAIGLRSHEMPDINLNRGGVLEAGNVICIEPGGYFPAARYGVRLENMYLITENGCEDLCGGDVALVVCG
jgi:Xaa-Pro dipeptidase